MNCETDPVREWNNLCGYFRRGSIEVRINREYAKAESSTPAIRCYGSSDSARLRKNNKRKKKREAREADRK